MVRFSGFLIYFAYGMWHSSERASNQSNYLSLEPSDKDTSDSSNTPSPVLKETTTLVSK